MEWVNIKLENRNVRFIIQLLERNYVLLFGSVTTTNARNANGRAKYSLILASSIVKAHARRLHSSSIISSSLKTIQSLR